MWEVINKERKRRKKVNEEIEMSEWKEHFMRTLGESEGRVVREEKRRREGKRGKLAEKRLKRQ